MNAKYLLIAAVVAALAVNTEAVAVECPHLTCSMSSGYQSVTHAIPANGATTARHTHTCTSDTSDTDPANWTCSCTCESGTATNDAGETGEDHHGTTRPH